MFRGYRSIMMTLAASTMTLVFVFGSLWSLTGHVQASDNERASLSDNAEGTSGSFLGDASLPNGVAAGDVTEFEISQESQLLTVTTHGIMSYSEADLKLHPSDILTRTPEIVSQFIVTPTQSIPTAITLSE